MCSLQQAIEYFKTQPPKELQTYFKTEIEGFFYSNHEGKYVVVKMGDRPQNCPVFYEVDDAILWCARNANGRGERFVFRVGEYSTILENVIRLQNEEIRTLKNELLQIRGDPREGAAETREENYAALQQA